MTQMACCGLNLNPTVVLLPVACRGGTNGAMAPGIQGRGHPKSEITKI